MQAHPDYQKMFELNQTACKISAAITRRANFFAEEDFEWLETMTNKLTALHVEGAKIMKSFKNTTEFQAVIPPNLTEDEKQDKILQLCPELMEFYIRVEAHV